MKKVVLLAFVLVVLSAATVLELSTLVIAHPAEIDVPDDYQKIQWAINNANEGDTINVKAGTYYEHVTVDKSISLIGDNAHNTIIDGDGTFGVVVHVTADNVNISGFTVQNRNKGDGGIWLDHCRNCTLSRNNVRNIGASSGVGGVGIELDYCKGCTVKRNNVSDNNHGIVLAFSHGCTVYGNRVAKNNKFAGIDMLSCSECMIMENILSNNENLGIRMYESSQCILKYNNITGSNQNFGVYGHELPHFVNDIDLSNTINSKPIVYLINKHDLTVNPSTHPAIGYLAVVNSANVTVENLTLRHNGEGVLFAYTNDSIIRRVSTSHNDYGIYVVNCDNCTVSENIATNNIYGIYLRYSYDCMVTENTATNNKMGIRLYDCRNCTVSGNQEQTVLFWMEWWFWATVIAGTVVLVGGVYFLKKRKPPIRTRRNASDR